MRRLIENCKLRRKSLRLMAADLLDREEGIIPEWEIDGTKLLVEEEEIGRGASASVHPGQYNGQKVAVKIIDCMKMREACIDATNKIWHIFGQEVKAWYKLDHPNITKFIGAAPFISFSCDTPCIVIEYLSGGTLSSFLRNHKEKKIPLSDVVRFALDIARGLSYLHSKKIVHRDIKPDNMLLDKDNMIKITDFGVACIESEIKDVNGTKSYMAPEVFGGKKSYDRKCDVYSFGICLWEIYCCDKAFDYTASHKVKKPKIPRTCPKTLAKVMKKCLNEDPRKRPEMEKVVSMLEVAKVQPSGCFVF